MLEKKCTYFKANKSLHSISSIETVDAVDTKGARLILLLALSIRKVKGKFIKRMLNLLLQHRVQIVLPSPWAVVVKVKGNVRHVLVKPWRFQVLLVHAADHLFTLLTAHQIDQHLLPVKILNHGQVPVKCWLRYLTSTWHFQLVCSNLKKQTLVS